MGYLEIKHLRLVNTIVETGSITNASKRLNLTQPALSLQLSDIETKLGAALFQRIGKKLVLTAAGSLLYDIAGNVLHMIGNAERKIASIVEGGFFRLIIGSDCVLSYKWLPGLMKRFQNDYPSTEIEFRQTSDFISDLKNGEIDIAVSRKTVDDPDVHFEPVFADQMVAVMTPDNPLSEKPFLTLDDCREMKLVTFSNPAKDDLYHQFLRPLGIQPAKRITVDQPEYLIELVRSGFGVSVLPIWSVKELLQRGELVAKKLTKDGVFFTWHMAMKTENRDKDCIVWFVNAVKKQGMM